MEDNVLTQLVKKPGKEAAPLELLLGNRKELVGNAVARGHLRNSDHGMMEFSILRKVNGGWWCSRTATLEFFRADFGLFRRSVDRISLEAILQGKGAKEGWELFKKEVLKAEEQAIPTSQKTS